MENNYDNNYIVPIYKKINGNYEFWGSGFIIEKYLISAAHVFDDEDTDFQVIFNNISVKLTNLIYREYRKGENIRYDLQIFKLENANSPYALFNGDYIWKEELTLDGFNMNENNADVIRSVITVKISENAYEYNYGAKPIPLKNCFSLYPKSKPGNSGCPIIKDNVIYGMNISQEGDADYMGSNAIRSDYIFSILSNI